MELYLCDCVALAALLVLWFPGREAAWRRLRQVHPLLIRDPRTGRRSMLYFPAFFYRFVGARGARLCPQKRRMAADSQ